MNCFIVFVHIHKSLTSCKISFIKIQTCKWCFRFMSWRVIIVVSLLSIELFVCLICLLLCQLGLLIDVNRLLLEYFTARIKLFSFEINTIHFSSYFVRTCKFFKRTENALQWVVSYIESEIHMIDLNKNL